VLYPEGTWYTQVQADEVPAIIEHVRGAEPSVALTSRANPMVRELILKMLDRYVERNPDSASAVGHETRD
jgi:(2Fe-2S) ferredoxin